MKWKTEKFTELVNDITGGNKKLQNSEYDLDGEIPIVDQAEGLIAAYTSVDKKVVRRKSVVVFGDHTKCLKFINFDFALGADGVKVLEPVDKIDAKYLYYFLQTIELPNVGYSRHYKFLKEISIPYPPLPTQQKIAAILDEADALRRKDKALLAKYDELLQAVFYDMFGDPVKNEKGWEKLPLKAMMKIDRNNISAENIDGNYSYLGLEHIEKETGRILLSVPTNEIDLKSNKFKFTPDHVLYGKLRPYLNKVALPDFHGICSTDILPIMPIPLKGNRWFITQILRSKHFVDYSNSNSIGANLPRANARIIEDYETIFPPIKMQIYFAQIYMNIQKQKSQIIQQQTHSENLFQSLMQLAFKGELVG